MKGFLFFNNYNEYANIQAELNKVIAKLQQFNSQCFLTKTKCRLIVKS